MGGEADDAAGRRVAHGVCRQVLKRLLEPVAIAGDRFGPRLDRRFDRDARRAARRLVPGADAIEQLRDADRLDREGPAAALEARELQQIANQPLEPLRFVADDRQVARACRLVERQLRHRQRLEVSPHRRHRRRQLVRHVGEQLAARPVRRRQGLRSSGQVRGHRVERAGDRRNLVAAAVGCARGEIAGAQTARRRFERAQSPPGGTEDHERCHNSAEHEHAPGDEGEHGRIPSEQEPERRLGRHDDEAGDAAADDDRSGADEWHSAGQTVEPFAAATTECVRTIGTPAVGSVAAIRPVSSPVAFALGASAPRKGLAILQPPSCELLARHLPQRLGKPRAAARDHAAVGEHHEERVGVLRVLVVDIAGQVRLRIALEHARKVEGHGRAQARRRLARQAAARL